MVCRAIARRRRKVRPGGAMMSHTGSVLLAVTMFGSDAAQVRAQEIACAPCQLTLTRTSTLSSDKVLAVPSLRVSVARLETGFAVSYLLRPPHIALFDESGTPVTSYDRTGSGPGELRYAPFLVTRGRDTLIAIDRTRFLWFDADLRPLATRNFAPFGRTGVAVALPTGGFAIAFDHRGSDERRYLVAILDASGRTSAHLEPALTPSDSTYPHLAEAEDGGFLVVRPNESIVRQYDASGTLVRTTRLQGSEFESFPASESWIDGRKRPYRAGITQLTANTVLVRTYVPSPNYRRPEPDKMFDPGLIDASAEFDTLLEVFELRSGRLLAVQRRSEALSAVRGSSEFLYSTHESDDGHTLIHLWRVGLRPN